MSKIYPLRSNQTWLYAFVASLFLGLILLLLFILLLPVFLALNDDMFLTFFIGYSVFIALVIVIGLIGFYQHFKTAKLIFDSEGIRVSSKVLSLIPSFAPLKFGRDVKIYRVDNYASTLLGGMTKLDPTLRQNDVAIIAVKQSIHRHHAQRLFIISDNIWQIDDVGHLQRDLEQSSQLVTAIPAREFINQYMQQFADLGKKAGFFAYGSIALALVAFGVSFFDKYSTIFYGSFQYVLWIVIVLSGIAAFFAIKGNPKQLPTHVMVASLFALTFGIMFFGLSLASVPFFGNEETHRFEFSELNKYEEERWVSTQNPKLEIYCRSSKTPEKARPEFQTVNVHQLFGVKRVKGAKLCPHSEFLSDAMLPHE